MYVASSGSFTRGYQGLGLFTRTDSGDLSYVSTYPRDEDVPVFRRPVTLSIVGDVFKGRVTVEDYLTLSAPDCIADTARFALAIQKRKADGSWAPVMATRSSWLEVPVKEDGTFKVNVKKRGKALRKGTFRVWRRAESFAGVSRLGGVCGEITSPAVKKTG